MRDRLGEHAGLERGDLTGPNPVDRGKNRSKIHLITEGSGLPVSVGISGANTHDSQALIPLVRGIPPIRSRTAPAQALQALRGQSLRLHSPATMVTAARHRPSHRTQGHRILRTPGSASREDRTGHGLARRMPPSPPPLRTLSRPLPGLHQHRLHPHLLPQAHQMRRPLSRRPLSPGAVVVVGLAEVEESSASAPPDSPATAAAGDSGVAYRWRTPSPACARSPPLPEADDRTVAGHREGGLILGARQASAGGALVDRATPLRPPHNRPGAVTVTGLRHPGRSRRSGRSAGSRVPGGSAGWT